MHLIRFVEGGRRSLARMLPLLLALSVLFLVGCSGGGDEPPAAAPTSASTVAASATASTSVDSAPMSAEPREVGAEAFLIVSDAAEEHLYVFSVPAGELVATFDHVELSAHTGALTLPDGRVLFSDDHDGVLRVLDLSGAAGPELVASAPIEPGQAWSAVDPDLRYYAGVSRTETEAIVYDVDLRSMTVAQLRLPVTEPGETHVALGGEPLSAFVWSGGTLYSYLVEGIMAGAVSEAASTLETGPGAHSQALDTVRGILWTSLPEMLHGVRIEGNTFGEVVTLPWNADGL
ncbi:MAG: hypothetical protein O2924_03630 [Chloroflexi bacterium]|nr:hypothetical protein [Chloroflexota bacterium]